MIRTHLESVLGCSCTALKAGLINLSKCVPVLFNMFMQLGPHNTHTHEVTLKTNPLTYVHFCCGFLFASFLKFAAMAGLGHRNQVIDGSKFPTAQQGQTEVLVIDPEGERILREELLPKLSILKPTQSVKILGVILDSELSFFDTSKHNHFDERQVFTVLRFQPESARFSLSVQLEGAAACFYVQSLRLL